MFLEQPKNDSYVNLHLKMEDYNKIKDAAKEFGKNMIRLKYEAWLCYFCNHHTKQQIAHFIYRYGIIVMIKL